MIDRAEHLAWCKQRALEYLSAGDIKNAITSMLSDLDKHPETRCNNFLALFGMRIIMDKDVCAARRWIEGFN